MGAQLKCISAPNEHHNSDTYDYASVSRHRVKVLFLDVDGVLNGETYGYGGVVDSLVFILKTIIDQTNCKIVLSTTWRLHQSARETLLRFLKDIANIDIDDIIIGDTPSIKDSKRAFEIESFLDSEPFKSQYIVTKWCSVDDMNLYRHYPLFMKHHFVQTNYRTGITSSDAIKVVKILNN